MSNQDLDSLFKKKLDQLEQKPSANAWDKLQAQTGGRKEAAWPWMRIAAAILLLITSGSVVWYVLQQPEGQTQMADKQADKPEVEQPVSTNEADDQTANNQDNELQSEAGKTPAWDNAVAQKENPKSQVVDRKENKPLANKEEKVTPLEQPQPLETIDQTENIASAEVPDATIEEQPASHNRSETQGTTLEFDLSDFDKTAVAANTKTEQQKPDEEKNAKGVGKVLNLMKELKSEAGLGDLRAAKDEIFAFNFKKDENGSK